MVGKSKQTVKLTPTMMVQLAAPHTWSAAIMPVVLGLAYAVNRNDSFPLISFLCMLAIVILMQSAVNTLNDYMDYVKGADTVENQLDPTDAVLVYNNVDPKSALRYFFALMAVALLLGLYLVFRTSWITLAIGIVAALIIVLYSVGKTPLSYLPLGEFVSGFTMGGLIMLASCYAFTGLFEWKALLLSVPVILSIGLINMTNNTCDIDKDREAKRRTLPALLGRERSVKAYHSVMYAVEVSICVLVLIFYPNGLPFCLMMVLAFIPGFRALRNNPLTLATRGPAMGQVVNLNIILNAFYALAIGSASFTPLLA